MFRSFCLTIEAALVLFAFTGCKTTGQQRTAYQVESIQQYRMSLDAGSKQINATVGALEQLAATTTGDLRPAYQRFTTELAKLDSDAAMAKARSDTMNARSDEHLDMWEKETQPPESFTNLELRKISEEQRAQARERFEDLRRTAETGTDAYNRLSTDLHEIQKILDLNLSPAAIAAIKPVVEQTRVDAQATQDAIGEIAGKLDIVKNALSTTSGGGPAPASGPPQPAPTPSSNP